MSIGGGKSKSSSKPLSAAGVATYFDKIDDLSGGRLGQFATGGTPGVEYAPLTADELRSLGGAGATRTAAVQRTRDQAGERIGADPSLTTFQRVRANQMADTDASTQLDAISKETEALLTQIAGDERSKQYQAGVNNAQLSREDMLALADIFFGGRGQSSSSRAFNFGLSGGSGGSGGGTVG